jgi:hypothetical protein
MEEAPDDSRTSPLGVVSYPNDRGRAAVTLAKRLARRAPPRGLARRTGARYKRATEAP